MGTIQGAINQGLALGAVALSQTPLAEAAKDKKLKANEYIKKESEFNERGKVFGALTEGIEIGEPGKRMTDEQVALFEGKTGKERSRALDLANEGYVAAAERMAELKPTAENFERVAHRREMGEQRHARRQELMAEANRRAKERVVAQNAQNQAAAEQYVWARNFVAGE